MRAGPASERTPMSEISSKTRAVLDRYHFDPVAFEGRRELLRTRGWHRSLAELSSTVEPLPPDELTRLPERGTPEREALARRGEEALRAGRVAVLLLNGGMA